MKKDVQLSLFGSIYQEEQESGNWQRESAAQFSITVLDQVHVSMILYAAGYGEALHRFLVAEGIVRDQRFWGLAHVFSALYPSKSEEKRWVDGVLAWERLCSEKRGLTVNLLQDAGVKEDEQHRAEPYTRAFPAKMEAGKSLTHSSVGIR